MIYADDICLMYDDCNANTITKSMESDLKFLNEWFVTNKLSLNVKKTKFILIAPKHIKNENAVFPKLNDMYIDRVYEYKYLGLFIDSDLKWTVHINYVKSKI